MRKQNRNYKPKDKTLFSRKVLAMFTPESVNPVDKSLIERFEKRFREINQNLEQGTADKKDLMSINGTYGIINILMKNSSLVEDLERYEIVLFITDKIKDMMDRIEAGQKNIGYKNDDELRAVTSLYQIAHDIFTTRGLTNRQYDLAVNILEKECALKNIKVY